LTVRLDRALVERGLARSRTHAQALIAAGAVTVNGEPVRRPAEPVRPDDAIDAETDPSVSRGAHKLRGALDDLGFVPSGRALDAGASTGGFTQVLLERGCREVTAVDVGTDQLAPSLRADPRVRMFERTNLRDLTLAHVGGEPVDLVVADVSFISLVLLVDRLIEVTRPDGRLLLMIKPQFEVGRERLGKGGVVRDETLRQAAVDGVVEAAAQLHWRAVATVPSRVLGPAGNLEYFALFRHI
jgi:23S rRNA (cytidine1920-2'-O)/16S rRNA (cytidine1409-2'-O)-methyltransferase